MSTIVRDGDRIVKVGEVDIETIDAKAGWAVFTGCKAHLHAWFASRAAAETYLRFCRLDTDSDDWLCDPDIAPSVIDMLAANHFDFEKGASAVAEAAHLTSYESENMLREAVPRPAHHEER